MSGIHFDFGEEGFNGWFRPFDDLHNIALGMQEQSSDASIGISGLGSSQQLTQFSFRQGRCRRAEVNQLVELGGISICLLYTSDAADD